jgi:hypothetical protein
MYFEDLEIGQTCVSGPRQVMSEQPVDGPADAAVLAADLWRTSSIGRRLASAELKQVAASWTSHGQLQPGERVRLHSSVVRLEARADAGSGDVTRWDELRNSEDETVHAGTSTLRVHAQDIGAHRTHRDVGTRSWAAALAEILGADAAFTSAVETWDGTLGVRGGRHEIQLRIYRGRIIEVTPRSPHGATFTFGASDRIWTEVLTEPYTSFGSRLMRGDFEVSGNPYEYLRLTKALELLVANARKLAVAAPREVLR